MKVFSQLQMKKATLALAVVVILSVAAPTIVMASQNTHQFNQSWLILGPYYRKNTGANPGAAAISMDYLTDGIITEGTFVPSVGAVVNTNYALPQCGSFSFVWRTRANGYDVPTVFRYDLTADDDAIDFRGGQNFSNGQQNRSVGGVFNQNVAYDANTNPQGTNRLNNTMVYAWAWINNKTTGNITDARVGIGTTNQRIEVLVDGVVRIANYTGGTFSQSNRVNTVSGTFTITPGLHLVTVKCFTGEDNQNLGFRCRFQSTTTTGVNQAAGYNPASLEWTVDAPGWQWPVVPPPTATASGWRKIHTYFTYTVGQPVPVTVQVNPTANPQGVYVNEFPPAGWTIGTPSVNVGAAQVLTTTTVGGYSGPYIKWNIGNMLSTTTAVMNYTVTPPTGASGYAYTTGSVVSNVQSLLARDRVFYGPTAPVGIFEWAGNVGQLPIGTQWLTNVPPFTYGTIITGNPAVLGSATHAGGLYTVTSAGADLGGNDDRAYFLAKRVTGDFILRADLKWTSPTSNYDCKAVVMVREYLTAGAPYVHAMLRNYLNAGAPQTTIRTRWRNVWWGGSSTNGLTDTMTTDSLGNRIFSQFKLVRRSNTVECYHFYQGQWQAFPGGAVTITEMTTAPVLACLAVSSNNQWSAAQAQFQNVSITPLPVISATRSFSSSGYTSQGVTVRIFLKNGGGTAAVTVREAAPTGMIVSNANPPATINGSTITWTLPAFAADTTLTYKLTPPVPDLYEPQVFGASLVTDQTNLLDLPIGGPGMVMMERATAFRQGMYPDPSYSGCEDTHIVMYRSRGTSGLGMNPGWYAMMEEGGGSAYGDDKISLIKFNIATIRPSATVFAAKLLLYQNPCRSVSFGGNYPTTAGTTQRLYAAKINRAWSEGRGSGAPDGTYANLGEASWFWAKAAQSPWASGGLRGGAADCDIPESHADISSGTINTWITWDVTRMAAAWVASPSSNNGIKISQDDQNTTHYPTAYGVVPGIVQFTSRNSGTAARRPLLVVLAYQPDILSAQHWELYR